MLHKTLITLNDAQRFGGKLFNGSLHVGSFSRRQHKEIPFPGSLWKTFSLVAE